MKILGFNFKKISAETFPTREGEIKVNTKIDIDEIASAKTEMFEKEEIVVVSFSYAINYEPKLALVEFKGNILLSLEPDKAKEIIDEWKDKNLSEDLKITLFNIILKKANIKALQLEDELNLPPHMPLPRVSPETKKKE